MNKSFHQTVGSWVQSMYLIHCWMEFLLRSFGKISSIGKVPRDREGTMILVDWGMCRIYKVLGWLRANIGTVFRDLHIFTIRRLSRGTPLGREIINVLREH